MGGSTHSILFTHALNTVYVPQKSGPFLMDVNTHNWPRNEENQIRIQKTMNQVQTWLLTYAMRRPVGKWSSVWATQRLLLHYFSGYCPTRMSPEVCPNWKPARKGILGNVVQSSQAGRWRINHNRSRKAKTELISHGLVNLPHSLHSQTKSTLFSTIQDTELYPVHHTGSFAFWLLVRVWSMGGAGVRNGQAMGKVGKVISHSLQVWLWFP